MEEWSYYLAEEQPHLAEDQNLEAHALLIRVTRALREVSAVTQRTALCCRPEPLVALGGPGTGKTHLLIGVALAAAEAGKRARYVTCAGLVNELAEAADERTLGRAVARYGRYELLCCDELGYLKLDQKGAELLFQVLTEREERASVAVASNAPFRLSGGEPSATHA